MKMSIERALDILDPASVAEHSPEEWVQAHRMACQALALLRWIPAAERKPEEDELVLGVVSAELGPHAWITDGIAIVEYDETVDQWLLEAWPEVEDVEVSHWMRLPMLPEGVGT